MAESLLAITEIPKLKRTLKGLKRHSRATSRLRDLDVFLDDLSRSTSLEAPSVRGALTAFLRQQTRKEHQALSSRLRQPAYHEEMKRWQHTIGSKQLSRHLSAIEPDAIRGVLHQRLARHDAELASLGPDSPDTDLHQLRKTVKRIRYLAELEPMEHRGLIDRLKDHQARLGDFQDLCTQLQLLDAFAASPDAQAIPEDDATSLATWVETLTRRKAELRKEILRLESLV
ncbi:hypothetical protein GCM10007160_36550 [Litchfieldella qijiaojingensis]|uniref:CHAD domain-containing protein n=1 Tax=Litchfieldella qijiaojingensis TaxID=980347 RepID=A0ABQ2Z5Y1_9GAMM|nr:hypothetical protein GCM10007160_36550 [Halomonas qijiaojingensis]